MRVKELKERLNEMDDNWEIMIYNDCGDSSFADCVSVKNENGFVAVIIH